MKNRMKVMMAATLLATVYVVAQTPQPLTAPRDTPQIKSHRYILQQDGDIPAGGTFKQLSDDVQLLVFQSERGEYRARLYVRIGTSWQPVAADGLGDIQRLLPAK